MDTGFDAVIFDMDGLLLDTERLSVIACKLAADDLGYDYPVERFHVFCGKAQAAISRILSEWTGTEVATAQFHTLWRGHYDRLTAESVTLRPSVIAALDLVQSAGLPYAIATTTEKFHAIEKLEKAGIAQRFQTIVGFNCVENRKPAPDPYLKAAQLLGVDPTHCLACEDSDTGAQAALSAGMTVIQIPDLAPAIAKAAHFRADTLLDGLQTAFAQRRVA